ncbi:MAG: SMP-30/gluconolactonase/LRE family protein [Kiritimatiellae bacterium]|nr:SMP-30/gluconolactonase/LRE family protein [Kiritimatiellia bacterium]MBQ3345014.1 SMP-30/gluconolactonase/LRE family protein [Kiritimatiellia bacterium]
MNPGIEILSEAACIVGESPVWIPERRELAMCDVHGRRVRRIAWDTGAARDFVLREQVGAVVPDETDGNLLVFAGKDVLRLSPDGSCETLAANLPVVGLRFNDVKRGPDGRIWGGTYSRDQTAAFYRLGEDWSVEEPLISGVGNSNGIAWDAERCFVYHVDTPRGTVTRYSYDIDAAVLSEARVVRAFARREGLPDGMCADVHGGLWVALWGAGKVVCIDSDTGTDIDAVSLPVSQPACPAFAGDNLDTLVVTTAAHGVNLREEPLAGMTFRIDVKL